MIFLTHEKHGHKIAYSLNEADRDKKVGWKEVSEEKFYDRKKLVKEDDKAIRTALVEKYEAKFGKKPHHKMSNESIEKALSE